jgi:hypothetical protein
MNIGPTSALSAYSSGPIEVTKKAQDVSEQQGAAALQLIESSLQAPPAVPVAEVPPPGSTVSIRA